MSVVLDNLNKQLEVAVKANVKVHNAIQEGKVANLKQVMKGFTLPEGFNVRFREYEVGLVKDGNNYESARVNIDSDYDWKTGEKTIRTSVSANGGREVDDLLAQAQFVQFASPKLDEFKVAVESVVRYFAEDKKNTGAEVREIEKAISDVKTANYQLKMDNLIAQMNTKEGYQTVIVESHWGGVDYPRLTLKRDYDREVIRVKILKTSASGKSVDVEFTYRLYDGRELTNTEERVRMDNIKQFVRSQLYRIEKIEEGELTQVTLEEINAKVEA